MKYDSEYLKSLLDAANPDDPVRPVLELAIEGAAHREAQTLQTIGSYLPMLRSQNCSHDHESKCDEFCADGGRRARECIGKFQHLTAPSDATKAEHLPE